MDRGLGAWGRGHAQEYDGKGEQVWKSNHRGAENLVSEYVKLGDQNVIAQSSVGAKYRVSKGVANGP